MTTGVEVLEIGSRLEPVVDNYWIDSMEGVQLRLHAPHPAEVVLQPHGSGYMTVLKDGGTYRMYYRLVFPSPEPDDGHEFTCYAESTDGIHWTKPDLGLFKMPGSPDGNAITERNVVTPGEEDHPHFPTISHNFRPFLDTRPGVSTDERFKALGAGFNSGAPEAGYWAMVSADGIHWRKLQEDWVIDRSHWPHGSDSAPPGVFWSDVEKCYVAYIRIRVHPEDTSTGKVGGLRWIGRTTSSNLKNWSSVIPVKMRKAAYYTNETQPYFRAPHIYLATPARFNSGTAFTEAEWAKLPEEMQRYEMRRHVEPGDNSGFTDVVLLTSRSGDHYDCTFEEAFLRPGLNPRNWGDRSTYPCVNLVPTSHTEMSIYVRHGSGSYGYVQRYTLRTDGIASINAPCSGGEVVTKPLRFSGRRLVINFSTSGSGSVQVEVQDGDGKPLPGYRLEDSRVLIGDAIERAVTWKSASDVSGLLDQTIRLRFVLKDTDLYSFRFHDADKNDENQ